MILSLLLIQPDPFTVDDSLSPALVQSFRAEVLLDPPLDLDHVGHDLLFLYAGGPEARTAHENICGAVVFFSKEPSRY